MGDLLAPDHIIFLLIVVLLIFGPKRLPELGSAVGKTVREFQQSFKLPAQSAADEKPKDPAQP